MLNLKRATTENIVKLLIGCERKADEQAAAKLPVDPRLTTTIRECKAELDQREGQLVHD